MTKTTDTDKLAALHVLWTIPITGILLVLKIKKKSAQIKAGWQGRKMDRCQSWPGSAMNAKWKLKLPRRWKSTPPRESKFDGIVEIE